MLKLGLLTGHALSAGVVEMVVGGLVLFLCRLEALQSVGVVGLRLKLAGCTMASTVLAVPWRYDGPCLSSPVPWYLLLPLCGYGVGHQVSVGLWVVAL